MGKSIYILVLFGNSVLHIFLESWHFFSLKGPGGKYFRSYSLSCLCPSLLCSYGRKAAIGDVSMSGQGFAIKLYLQNQMAGPGPYFSFVCSPSVEGVIKVAMDMYAFLSQLLSLHPHT